DVHAGGGRFKQRRHVTHRLVIRQTVEAFVIVSAPAPAVIPAKRFVDVVSRERSGGPVMTVRTRFGIHEETIEESKAQCKRTMIWRDLLSLSVRSGCRTAGAEDRE